MSGVSPAAIPSCEADYEKWEKEHVHDVYSKIAAHFSHTRFNPWPGVTDFLSSIPPYSTLLDVGCGNAKYARVRTDIAYVGADYSQELLSIASKRSDSYFCSRIPPQGTSKPKQIEIEVEKAKEGYSTTLLPCSFLRMDISQRFPFGDGTFSHVIFIAALHHLSTPERRKAALHEVWRVCKPGGTVLIYVWAMEQTGKRKVTTPDSFVEWRMPQKFICTAKATSHAKRSSIGSESEKKISSPCDSITPVLKEEEGRKCDCDSGSLIQKSKQEIQEDDIETTIRDLDGSDREAKESEEKEERDMKEKNIFKRKRKKKGTNEKREDSVVYNRYYHFYKEGELSEQCLEVGFEIEEKEKYDHSNWRIVVKKP
ncbi:Probable tRNA methyltransferase 9-like protein like protein [Aduncisulcus paluster]|uniref:Probable tRNA methyltransferase 9-like protein like protein n=1 Tax=Aduncisulcus paluster TaxID=2918883 RepID=A0ABQ5KPG4_9EUKA|nr:Probable tRNA methyltransferase 9-like protein like protein [Aduncisulcus paluster]